MQVLDILTLCLAILTSQTILSAASKAKILHSHHHGQHHRLHEDNEDEEKKSKTATGDKTMPAVLPKFPKGSGLGILSIPTSLILGLGKAVAKQSRNVKTKRNTTTKINGGFKTVTTVIQQLQVDKHNKTKIIGQSVQSVTTPVNATKSSGKKEGFLLDFSPLGSYIFGDEPERECSAKKPCKKKGTYCDKLDWQCQPTGKPGSKCNQPGQCSVDKGKFACIWGKCSLLSTATGYSGRFCEKEKECGSEDMQCVPQNDVSEVSNICVGKLGEGQTCGRSMMFDFWPFRRSSSRRTLPCKKGLACAAVGYSGRMVCRPAALLKDDEKEDDEKEDDEKY